MPKKVPTKNSNKRSIEQYEHKDKKRTNNPPVGLVTPDTDIKEDKKMYQYDPHLDPQLQWAGKAEHTSFEIPTVSLHVHERIDPRSIIEAVRKKNGSNYEQLSLFNSKDENPPLRDAIEFYKHRHNWSNRLVSGDSLLVMNSLIEKEGLAGQVQMIYFDPPYGIKYGSNFQPFVNKRDVKDGKDEDLSQEPEMIKAFRDTWELEIHSYLTYLRDRLLLSKELLNESGSVFVQISDDNVHHVREVLDEVFGPKNECATIVWKKGTPTSKTIRNAFNYILWYTKDISKASDKIKKLFFERTGLEGTTEDPKKLALWGEFSNELVRPLTTEEKRNIVTLSKDVKIFRVDKVIERGNDQERKFEFGIDGEKYIPKEGYCWRGDIDQMKRLLKANRLIQTKEGYGFKFYISDFPVIEFTNLWEDTAGNISDMVYVVQTNEKIIQRCMLMATNPGDLVFDPTCGSGTTSFVAEEWGRRWITCDTSRVAITLAKQRIMTSVFDYFKLAYPEQGVGSGLLYKTVPHITLKSIANNEPPGQETLYNQPFIDNSRTRVTGPFTVEAVPAPVVKPLDSGEWVGASGEKDKSIKELNTHHTPLTTSIARSGETLRQSEWRDELLKTGIRGKKGQYIYFSRVEPIPGTRYLHADAETKIETKKKNLFETENQLSFEDVPQRAVISFGPEHAPLEQRQVALAIEEAQKLVPKPKLVVFAAFQFDPEAAKDIDETEWPGVSLLKVQMNTDLLTDDLKKKRSSNESYWLIGQPDIRVIGGEWLVDRNNKRIVNYDDFKKLSGINSLAEINKLSENDLRFYTTLSERRDLWIDIANKESRSFNSGKHSGGTGEEHNGGVHTVSGNSERVAGGIGDINNIIREFELHTKGSFRKFIEGLRRNKQIIERSKEITIYSPLTTKHLYTIEVKGFDYFNTKTGQLESGGNDRIAVWMLDTDYDGRSLFPRQVFFPMAGEKEGWTKLAKNLKAEIDEELIEAFKGTISLPFEAGKYNRVAVKIVDDRGIESLKVIEI
jgi:adenine-specific DNA-methyltransferase